MAIGKNQDRGTKFDAFRLERQRAKDGHWFKERIKRIKGVSFELLRKHDVIDHPDRAKTKRFGGSRGIHHSLCRILSCERTEVWQNNSVVHIFLQVSGFKSKV